MAVSLLIVNEGRPMNSCMFSAIGRICAILLCFPMLGCGTAVQTAADKVTEVTLGAVGIKLPEKTDLPRPSRSIAVRMEATKDLNAGEDGQGLATVMRLYKLRDYNSFLATPYASFGGTEKEKQAIGADLMEVREVILAPGQTLDLKEKMSGDAAYLGVVALFRTPFPQRWRFAFATADAERSGITLGAHTCAMTATQPAPIGTNLNDTALLSPVRCK